MENVSRIAKIPHIISVERFSKRIDFVKSFKKDNGSEPHSGWTLNMACRIGLSDESTFYLSKYDYELPEVGELWKADYWFLTNYPDLNDRKAVAERHFEVAMEIADRCGEYWDAMIGFPPHASNTLKNDEEVVNFFEKMAVCLHDAIKAKCSFMLGGSTTKKEIKRSFFLSLSLGKN